MNKEGVDTHANRSLQFGWSGAPLWGVPWKVTVLWSGVGSHLKLGITLPITPAPQARTAFINCWEYQHFLQWGPFQWNAGFTHCPFCSRRVCSRRTSKHSFLYINPNKTLIFQQFQFNTFFYLTKMGPYPIEL